MMYFNQKNAKQELDTFGLEAKQYFKGEIESL